MTSCILEEPMRNWTRAAEAIIVAVALYFAVAWGSQAVDALASPAYGLDDVWRSQVFFAIGRFFGLAPVGMVKVAAFFATVKLAVAVICGWHVIARLRALISGKRRYRHSRGRPDPDRADQHRAGRPGGMGEKRHACSRIGNPASARGACHRPVRDRARPAQRREHRGGHGSRKRLSIQAVALSTSGAIWFSSSPRSVRRLP